MKERGKTEDSFGMSLFAGMDSTGFTMGKQGIWAALGVIGFLIAGIAIATGKLIYLGALFVPLMIYLSLMHPFIFPFGAYAFLIPFDQLLSLGDFGGGLTLTKVLGICIIPVLFMKGTMENKMHAPDPTTFLWISLVLYAVLSVLWAIQPGVAGGRVSTAVGLILLYLMSASYKAQRSELEALKWCILCGGILAAILTINNFRSLETATRATVQIGERTALLNQLAFDLLLPVSVCLEKVLADGRMMKKALFGLLLGIIIFSIIITGSRGALLGLGAIFIVYVLSIKEKKSIVTILVVLGIVLMITIPSFFIERLEESVEKGGAGRTTIWLNGLKALDKYWITGAGLNNFPEAYREVGYFSPYSAGLGRASHNLYLGMFVELGIVGFVLMLWGIAKHYTSIRPRFACPDSSQVMLKAALLGMLISSFFLDTFWYKSLWMLWMMIIMHKNVLFMRTADAARARYQG
ncbi:MAG: hypothetical protein C0402_14170 [Thermodesulfovibrio sp.]|nr:hypothetical protein [Thermodesulfovibrio sp.]